MPLLVISSGKHSVLQLSMHACVNLLVWHFTNRSWEFCYIYN